MFILAAFNSYAQKSAVFLKDGAAIGGYDPVAFFREQKAVKGSNAHATEWNGATWKFANKENLDSFMRSPLAYAPQYGGYCAYGMADGHKAPTEADTWTIVDGKLYFNYNQKVKTFWNKDIPGYIAKADANWPKLKDKE